MTEQVVKPSHYNSGWEIGEFIHRQGLGFLAGNVCKYLCRYKKKNGLQDLKKAQQYLEKLIAEEELTLAALAARACPHGTIAGMCSPCGKEIGK